MKPIRILAATLIVLLVSCAPSAKVYWRDGNFKVYATPSDYNATKLGYDHHPGLLGVVDAEVVAVGSTAQCVFAERTDPASNRTEFFIIPKEATTDTHSGKLEGPYTTAQFQEIRAARQLPDFAWRKAKRG